MMPSTATHDLALLTLLEAAVNDGQRSFDSAHTTNSGLTRSHHVPDVFATANKRQRICLDASANCRLSQLENNPFRQAQFHEISRKDSGRDSLGNAALLSQLSQPPTGTAPSSKAATTSNSLPSSDDRRCTAEPNSQGQLPSTPPPVSKAEAARRSKARSRATMGSMKAEIARLQVDREQLMSMLDRQGHDLQRNKMLVQQLTDIIAITNPSILQTLGKPSNW